MAGSIATQLTAFGLGVAVGLEGVGRLQVLTTLLGPFMIVMLGTGAVIVPELAAILGRSPRLMQHACLMLSVSLCAAAAVWGAVVWAALPHGVGRVLVGSAWVDARPLVPLAALGLVCMSPGAGAGGGLHALGASRRSLRAMLVGGTLRASLSIAGAAAGGLGGALIGAAVATTITSGNWWRELRAAVRDYEAGERHRSNGPHKDPTSRTATLP